MTTKWPGGFITASPTAPSSSAASGQWTLEQASYYLGQNAWPVQPGQQAYVSSGTYSWVAPVGVNFVSVVLVGPGGGPGGSGGALSYRNDIAVNPGQAYAVRVAAGGTGQTSYFEYQGTTTNLRAGNGSDRSGQGGGSGGTGNQGGGGAGGYSSSGGNGGNPTATSSSSGGGGGGGADSAGYGGGGVGILGQGANGTGGTSRAGTGGSGGTNGGGYSFCCCYGTGGSNGGLYGGAAGTTNQGNGQGGRGAVRIIWGAGRAFPSTNTGDL